MELAGGKLPGALDGARWSVKPPELFPQLPLTSTRKRSLKCRPPACGWGGAGIFSNIFIEMVVNCKQEMDRSGKARDGGRRRARR